MLKIFTHKNLHYFFLCVMIFQSVSAKSQDTTPINESEVYSVEKIMIEIERFSPTAEKDPQSALALKYYRQAKSYVEKTLIFKKNEKDYKLSIETNPIQEQQLKDKNKSLLQTQSELFQRFNQEKSEIELSRLYAQQKALIVELRQQRLTIMEKINAAKLLPDKITQSRDEIYKLQDKIRIKLNEISQVGDNKEVLQANQISLQLEQTSLLAQLNMLEAQRLSLPSYLSLLETELALIMQTITMEEKIEQQMLQQLEVQRQKSQESIEDETSRLNKIILDYPFLKSVIETNSLLNDEHKLLSQNYSKINQLFLQETKRRELLERNLQRLNQQIAIDAPDSLMGEFLYQQKEELALIIGVSRNESETKLRGLQLGKARLSQFKVDDQLQFLNEKKDDMSQLLIQLDTNKQWLSLSQEQQNILVDELTIFSERRVTILKRLREQYISYIKLINDLKHEEQQVDEKSRLYAEILDEHLWLLPSNTLIDLNWFKRVMEQAQWLLTGSNWKQISIDFIYSTYKYLGKSISSALLVVLLFVFKYRLKKQVIKLSSSVNKVVKDSYWLTIKVLIITLILAMPWAILMYSSGYLLIKSPSTGISNTTGIVLIELSKYLFILEFIRYTLMRKGLAEVHFRWKPALYMSVFKNMRWFVPIFAFSWLIIELTQIYFDKEGLNINELGRAMFLLFIVFFLVFLFSLQQTYRNNPNSIKHKKLFILSFSLMLIVSITLFVAATLGYYFTAVRILHLLLGALYIIFFLYLIYSLSIRWLTLIQARLSYQQAQERQAIESEFKAQLKNNSESKKAEDTEDITISEVMDIQLIKTQVRRILNWVLILSIVIALGWHFREVSPVFNTMDKIELWKYSIDEQNMGVISLWDLLISILAILLTIAGARNIPGLLELSLFNLLEVEAGTRYAVSRIIQYIIFMIGFVVSVAWLGLAWSNVQWLVTAMSVGLGFGLKEIFSNFFSGLILLFERPIRIGDVVTIGQVSGTVSKIQIRSTTIIDWDKKELIIPNQSLILENLVNWTLSNHTTRVTFMLGLAYNTDIELAQKVITETLKNHPLVLQDPEPSALLINFGDSSLDFEIRVFVAETDHRMKTKHELHKALVNAMRENQIVIPFPQRDVHFDDTK